MDNHESSVRDMIDYLVRSINGYKGSGENSEFQRFLLLQSHIEMKLRTMVKAGDHHEIFTPQIAACVKQATCMDIEYLAMLTLEQFIKERRAELGQYKIDRDWVEDLECIKHRRCLLLPLYSLASGNSYESTTKMLADKFGIPHDGCYDVKPVHEITPRYSCAYAFRNTNNKVHWVIESRVIDDQLVSLPIASENHGLYLLKAKLPLCNLNLVGHNPEVPVYLTDSLHLAKVMQEERSKSIFNSQLEKQKRFWMECAEMASNSIDIPQYLVDALADKDKVGKAFINALDWFGSGLAPQSSNGHALIGIMEFLGAGNAISNPNNSAKEFWDTIINNGFRLCSGNSNLSDNVDYLTAVYRKTDLVWTSWYGGVYTMDMVDFSPLDGRDVVFVHYGHLDGDKQYELMLNVYAALKCLRHVNIKFVYLPSAANTIQTNCNGHEELTVPELLLRANERDVYIPPILRSELDAALRDQGKGNNYSFLVKPVIGVNSYNLLVAARGAGKSYVALSIAYALANGRNFTRRWTVGNPRKVLYINGEMDERAVLAKRKALFKNMYCKGSKSENLIIKTEFEMNLLDKVGIDKVESYLSDACSVDDKHLPVSLLILDNLLTLAPGAQHECQWVELQQWFRELKARDISILLVHHKAKDDTTLGTSLMENYADVVVVLHKEIVKKRLRIKFSELKNRRSIEGDPFTLELREGKRAKWLECPSERTFNWKSMSDIEKLGTVKQLREERQTIKEMAIQLEVSPSTIDKYLKDNKLTKQRLRANK